MKNIGTETGIGRPDGTDPQKGEAVKDGKEAEDTRSMGGMKAEEAEGRLP